MNRRSSLFLAIAVMGAGWLAGSASAIDLAVPPDSTHRVAIINDGYDALLLRVHLIRRAQHSIDLQTFLDKINAVFDGLFGLLPVDVWPIQNTTSYAWVPGHMEVPPDHSEFRQHYREAGDFPGADGVWSRKEIITRLYKVVAPVLTPML